MLLLGAVLGTLTRLADLGDGATSAVTFGGVVLVVLHFVVRPGLREQPQR